MDLFQTSEYESAIEKVMIHLLPSDGNVKESDIKIMKSFYQKVTGRQLSDEQIQSKLNTMDIQDASEKLEGYAYFRVLFHS